MIFTPSDNLVAEHRPEAIRRRLAAKKSFGYLGDAILGAIDGSITTFAVVSGVWGGGLASGVAILLGFANLLADGFSMAVSNYQRCKSQLELVEQVRRAEEEHIRVIPDGEKEEIRQIFSLKGFRDPLLGQIVDKITADRKLWLDSMITEEWGLPLEGPGPFRSAAATFAAFLSVGSIPVLPFLFTTEVHSQRGFFWSAAFTFIALFTIGALKGHILKLPRLRSGLFTSLTGGGAAFLAFIIGWGLREFMGTRM